MKKLTSIFLALTLLAGLFAIPAAADDTNLLLNGDFGTYEEGRFTGWTVQTTDETGNTTSYKTHSELRENRTNWGYCLTLSKNKDFAYYYMENVPGGKTYELSFDYQSLTEGRLEMMLSSRPDGGDAVDYNYIFFPATGEEWERCSFKYFVPETCDKVQVAFRVGAQAGEDGEVVKFDEIKFCPAEAGENLSFESGLDGWMVSDGAEVSEDAKTGAKSLKLSAGETASRIVLTDGNSMDISAYAKATAGATASVKVMPINNGSNLTAAEEITVSDADWKKAEFKTLLTGEGPAPEMKKLFPVMVELSVTGEGEAYFDGIVIDDYVNLVTDPSFERAGTNTYWKNRQSGGAALSTYRKENAYAPHGSYVIEIPADLAKKVDIKNQIEIPLEAGKQYEFSFWMCGVSGHSQAYVYPYEEGMDFTKEDSSYRVNFGQVKRTQTSAGDNVWRKQSVVFYAPKAGETVYSEVTKADVTLTNDTAGCWIQVGKTASTAANLIRYDKFCLREVDEYAGFYNDAPLQYINDVTEKLDNDGDGEKETTVVLKEVQHCYAALGEEIVTLSAGSYEFRFGNSAMIAADDTATGLVALYEKKADGGEMLVKVLALAASQYMDVTRSINTSATAADAGFQVPFTLEEADIADAGAEYIIKGFGWTSAAAMAPIVSTAVLEK